MDSTTIWALVVIVIILGLYFWARDKQKKFEKNLLRRQATKRNGRIEDVKEKLWYDGSNTYTKLILSHGGYKNIETYTKEGGEAPDFTYAKASINLSKNVNLKLYKRGGISKLLKGDIQTGNPEFDDVFNIKVDDKNFGRQFFTPKVQHKLLSLKRRECSLRITKTELALEIFIYPRSMEDYDNIIETALSLFESLQRQEMLK
jgi:hypothetical protein